jgi:hypothetical protein
MNSHTGNIKSDLEFSKNLINNLVAKKSNPVEEAAPTLSPEEKQEMTRLSEAVGEITGMEGLVIKKKPIQKEAIQKSPDIIEECLRILDKGEVNSRLTERMLTVIDHHEQTEKIILQFLGKYR